MGNEIEVLPKCLMMSTTLIILIVLIIHITSHSMQLSEVDAIFTPAFIGNNAWICRGVSPHDSIWRIWMHMMIDSIYNVKIYMFMITLNIHMFGEWSNGWHAISNHSNFITMSRCQYLNAPSLQILNGLCMRPFYTQLLRTLFMLNMVITYRSSISGLCGTQLAWHIQKWMYIMTVSIFSTQAPGVILINCGLCYK